MCFGWGSCSTEGISCVFIISLRLKIFTYFEDRETITTGQQGHTAHLLWDTKFFTLTGGVAHPQLGILQNCILGCKFVLQSHFNFICIYIPHIELEVTVFGPMSSGFTAAADIRGGLCLPCSINIHWDRVTGGGVGMGKAGGDWLVED
jgi:hypothetical protein